MQRVYFFPILCCFFFPFFFSHCIAISQGLTYKYIQYRYSRIRERIRCAVKRIFFSISHLQSRGYFFFFSEGRGGLHPLETSSMPSTAASLVFIFSVCSHWSMRKSVVMQRFVSLSEIIGKKKKNRNISHCIGTAPSCVEKRPSTFFFLWFHPQCLRIFRPRHRVHIQREKFLSTSVTDWEKRFSFITERKIENVIYYCISRIGEG